MSSEILRITNQLNERELQFLKKAQEEKDIARKMGVIRLIEISLQERRANPHLIDEVAKIANETYRAVKNKKRQKDIEKFADAIVPISRPLDKAFNEFLENPHSLDSKTDEELDYLLINARNKLKMLNKHSNSMRDYGDKLSLAAQEKSSVGSAIISGFFSLLTDTVGGSQTSTLQSFIEYIEQKKRNGKYSQSSRDEIKKQIRETEKLRDIELEEAEASGAAYEDILEIEEYFSQTINNLRKQMYQR